MTDIDEITANFLPTPKPERVEDARLTARELVFISAFQEMQRHVYNTAKEHGWWEDQNPNKLEKLMLVVSELGEAVEWLRKDKASEVFSDHITSYLGVEEELADVVIRLMDMSEHFTYMLAHAIVMKARFNETRPYRHGNKTA